MSFPANGMSAEEIERVLDELQRDDIDRVHGAFSVWSMDGPGDVLDAQRSVGSRFVNYNQLFAAPLPSVEAIRSELASMCLDLLGGGPDARATFTSGGSESIFIAVHAAREWARAMKPHIEQPEVVAPYSAHAAFTKACHYLGLTLRRVPLGPDFRADVAAMEAALGPNVIAVIGSAPSWHFARFDAIAELATLASERSLWMHVDACVGGYLAPFVKMAGYPIPDFDLRVPGVCSLSADLHKHGYAPPPCSTVLYSRAELKTHEGTVVPTGEWPGRNYATEGVSGSKPFGSIASAWATFRYLGAAGYVTLARRMMEVKAKLEEGIGQIPQLTVWETDIANTVFGAKALNIKVVAQGMTERGWFSMGVDDPPLMLLVIRATPDETIDAFVNDLAEVVHDVETGVLTTEGELRYT